MFGYSADEMIGKNIRLLIPDERQAEEDDILANLRAGRYIEHYETVRADEGRRHPATCRSRSRRSRTPTGTIVGASKIIRDISARKRAEDALIAANAKFESVFNQSGIFAGIMDPGRDLIEVNDLAVDWCGYTREEVLGRPFWETPWWRGSRGDAGPHPQRRRSGAAGRSLPRDAALLACRRHRAHRRLRDAPDPRRARRRALPPPDRNRHHRARAGRAALPLARLDRHRRPLDGRPDGRFAARSRRGRSTRARAGRSTVVSAGSTRCIPTIACPCVRRGPTRRRAATSSRRPGACGMRRPGEHRHVVARATPIRSADGGVDEWVGACTDVHERTLAEEALRAQEAEEREIAIELAARAPARTISSAPRGSRSQRTTRPAATCSRSAVTGTTRSSSRTGGSASRSATSSATASPRPRRWGSCGPRSPRSPSTPSRPGALLSRLDGFLARTRTTDFATVCYAVLDPATRRGRVRLGRPSADARTVSPEGRRPGWTAPSRRR